MLKNLVFLFILISSHSSAQMASPIQAGPYFPGIMGVRDYSNPGQEGLFLLDYNIFLHSDSYLDRNGDKVTSIDFIPQLGSVPFEVDISVYINSLILVYASPKIEFLGNAQYIFIANPIYSTGNTLVGLGELYNQETITGGAAGFGDLTISPIMLSWGSNTFDFTTGYMFIAPTGKYATGGDDNVGLGYWSHIFQAAAYYYPLSEKAMAILLMPSYELHSSIKDVDVTPGSRFILEYGISQYLTDRFEITLQGGHAWQIGDDKGNDVFWDTSVKDQMSTFGAGLGYWFVPEKFYANAKYSSNYNNKQHFSSSWFQVQLMYIPNWLKDK